MRSTPHCGFAPLALLFLMLLGAGNRVTPAAEPSRTAATTSSSSMTATEAGASDTHVSETASDYDLPIDLTKVQRLRVAGEEISETPLRVGNLDLLAPFVPQLPLLGATATFASEDNIPDISSLAAKERPQKNQFFQLNFPPEVQAPPLVFAIGRSVAYIDKEPYALRVAPILRDNKLWLPIFSVAPLLGAAPRFDPNTGTLHLNPTVQSVEVFEVKGVLAVTIKTSAPLPAGRVLMGTLENPPKIYFDFPGYSMGFDAGSTTSERPVAGGLQQVEHVRAGLFQDFPDTTRVVLDCSREMRVAVQPLPDKTIYAMLLYSPQESRPANTTTTSEAPRTGSLRGVRIVVDAGHGGHDAGAGGGRSNEKDHTLDIARRLRNHLLNRGAVVSMTREGDYFITLQGRVDFAHRRNADIFFSVHINSYAKTSSGTETYYYASQSRALANEVHKQLVKATGLPNRGVRQARFYVIRKTRMPSVLTETAFISNPAEEKKLLEPAFRERVARSMAQGIANYIARYRH